MLTASVVAPLTTRAAAGGPASRDLTPEERQTFLALACMPDPGKPPAKGEAGAPPPPVSCLDLPSYPDPDQGGKAPGSLSLDAIAVGDFSTKGADEAWITYSSDREGAPTNAGGGVIFRRTEGAWKLIKWMPGEQADQCVSLPSDGAARLLCIETAIGQGEVDSGVWTKQLANLAGDDPVDEDVVLKAQDGRQTGSPDEYCAVEKPPRLAMLLSIDALGPGSKPGEVAAAKVTYATAADAESACGAHKFDQLKETEGVVGFTMSDDKVVAVPPVKFAPVQE